MPRDMPSTFFFVVLCKILMDKGLRDRGVGDPGKILSHKDLRVKSSGIRTWLPILSCQPDGWRRTGWENFRASLQLARSGILSKGCSSQFWGIFLWKAVDKAERKSVGLAFEVPTLRLRSGQASSKIATSGAASPRSQRVFWPVSNSYRQKRESASVLGLYSRAGV
jgi:hypothetical protein